MLQLVETDRMRVEAESLRGVLWVQVYFKDPDSGRWRFDAGAVPPKQLAHLKTLIRQTEDNAHQERTPEGA